MARIGGRAARWAVGASAAVAGALLVTAGAALGSEDAALQPAAIDLSAPSSTSVEAPGTAPSVTAPSVTAPPSSAAASEAASASSSTATTSGPSTTTTSSAAEQTSTSSTLSTSATASATPTPSTAIVDPGPAEPEYYTWPGATADAPLVSFIGDSWTYGIGATDLDGYAYLTGRELGWAHRVLGVGGSGYVRGGAGNVPFDERILPAVSGNPDVVVIQGSINERSTPSPELAAAVRDTLTRLVRAAGPDTAVVVVGASNVPGVPAQYVVKVNDIVRAEAARLGLPFVDVAAEVWSDPADPSIWADPYHVNDTGAQQIADRLAPVLQGVLAG
jgi:lysophospholipase L1-like esterase